MKPLAIVTPWFGAALTGGAEQIAYQLAARLAARRHRVEVLTTCCRSFADDWAANFHAPGETVEDSFVIRRFPVNDRRAKKFEEVNERLLRLRPRDLRPGVSPLAPEDEETFVKDNINSRALLEHLGAAADRYHAFVFLPYLYGPALQGLPLVAASRTARAFLQPCLHDEAYAYLRPVARLAHAARGLLFNSTGELRVGLNLYGPGLHPKSTVVGLGIEPTIESEGQLPARLANAPFVLCLGRKDATKNTDALVRAFKSFRRARPASNLLLVLAGPGPDFGDTEAGVIDLGLVTEAVKGALLGACLALFQPSRHESYSRVMMEAWRRGRPVAVNRACLATATAQAEATGGWAAETEEEWAELFALVDTETPNALRELGERGAAYAARHADWERVLDRYEAALEMHAPRPVATISRPHLATIHQLLPNLSYGDAISNQALEIRDRLRALGFRSEIYVKQLGRRVEGEGHVFATGAVAARDGLIYHHSIGSELTIHAIKHRGPKCLVYHNITPAEFFAPYRPGFAWMLEAGREDLARLAKSFAVSVGDSLYNAAELAARGFSAPGVLPIIVNPARWDAPADEELMKLLQDGTINVLYVGRFSPNKRQDELVAAFAEFAEVHPESRLILAGDGQSFDPFYRRVRELIDGLRLGARVRVTELIEDAQLAAYYRTAHLFWSMSEHEGFGVPPVEAMWFDVPVLARRAAATPETLGPAGVLFDDQGESVAAAARLVTDARWREEVIAEQRRRRELYTPSSVWPVLDELVAKLEKPARAAAR